MSIRIYKNFLKPQAIGFDLDDTLYDNLPVLKQAESKLQSFLHDNFEGTKQYSPKDWLNMRDQVIALEPPLVNDTSASRLAALRHGLLTLGYSEKEAQDGASLAFDEFIYWRNHIDINDRIHILLNELRQHFKLFVISNGNADIARLGIDKYFEFALHPSKELAMKPGASLFNLAQRQLDIPAQYISYVGDHPVSDIIGANNAGWQSIWLNEKNKRLDHYKKPLQLPTVEVTSLQQLHSLY